MKDDGDKELDGKIKMEGFSQKAATARKSQVCELFNWASSIGLSNYMKLDQCLDMLLSVSGPACAGRVALAEQIGLQYQR